jgi:hypothetical protein
MGAQSGGGSNTVDRLERTGMAGMLRGIVAGFAGVGLWLGLLFGWMSLVSGDGEAPSVGVIFLALVLTALVSVVPLVLSQMTRGRWVLEETGIQETLKPLVSFLPFGLHQERFVRWHDIEGFGIREIQMRGNHSDGTPRILHYFRITIPGRPHIEFRRKEAEIDAEFDGFVAEFTRRMEGRG